MKKISIALIIALITICSSCAGYKPIFNESNLNFEIINYSLQGETEIAKSIYYKLDNLSKNKNNKLEGRKINLIIEVLKKKQALSKDGTGQVLEYNMTLKTKVLVKDSLTNTEILNYQAGSSVAYSVQERYSDTLKFENNSINNLIDSIYQEFLIKLTDSIKSK